MNMRIIFNLKNWRELNFLLNKIIVLVLFSLIPWFGKAQVHSYQGRVFDTQGQPLEFANVVLLNLSDSAFIEGSITNSAGKFILSSGKPIEHLLVRVSLMGYQTKFSTPLDIDSIVLTNSSIQLAEVVVKGSKKAFSIKDNKLVCNVAGTSLSSESNINDVLGKLPGFYTQGDELRTINQGSIKYYLNNRPATAEEIARFDVKAIKSIEIDSHPGTRYSGEIGSVVFIHTVSPLEGISAFLRSYSRVNHRLSQGFNGEIRYRYKKINMTLGADYSTYQSRPQESGSFELLYAATPWKMESTDTKKKNRNTEQTYFANFEYNFTDQHQLNLRYTRRPSHFKARLVGDLSVWKEKEHLYEDFENNIAAHSTEDNINLYYSGVLNKYWTIDFSSDWFLQKSNSDQDLQEGQRLTNILSGTKSLLWGFSPRAVYRRKKTKIEMGVDWSKSIINGWTKLNIEDAQPTDNKIQETKKAGYIGINWAPLNDRWNIALGIRYEKTNKKYEDHTAEAKTQSYVYNTLLPSFALSYSSGKWLHQFNYHTTIEYPTFSQLTSGEVYINRYNIKVANPSLKRSIVHGVSYDCSFDWLHLSAGYTYTDHPISETFELDSYKGEYRVKITPQNLNYMQGLSAVANAAPRFGLYEPRFMLGYIQNFITLPGSEGYPSHSISKPFIILALNNSLTFPHQWVLNLDYSYNGAGSNGYIEYSSSSSLNFSVIKQLFNKNLKISLRLTDIFDTSTPRLSGQFKGVLLKNYSWMDSRSARLTVVWYFNHYRTGKKHSSISSEINRL